MQVGCPRCPALVNVPVTMAGQMVVCPTCGLSYQVPGYAPPSAPPTVPPNAPLPPFPPPPQYGAPQYPAPQYAAPPAPAYGASAYGVPPPPAMMPPPELMQSAPLPPAASASPPPAPAPAAAPQPVAPASGLKPLEVLAPPSASLSAPGAAKSEPKRLRWQHEKRSQPEPARPPKSEESPTSMLPPATAKEFRAALAPANADEAAKAAAPAGGASAKIPESAFPKSPDGGTALPGGPRVVGPARMDLSAVEERLAQQRRKTQTTIAVALFGLTAMTLFAWFVVNLSRPQ